MLFLTTGVFAQQAEINRIQSNSIVDIIISQSETSSVEIEGSEKDKAVIKTAINEGKLTITVDGIVDDDAKVKVTMKELKELAVQGIGDVRTEGQITTSDIEIKVSGAGDADLTIAAKNIKATVSGAGDLKLKGKADFLLANVSGAGDLRAAELETKNAVVVSTGAGDAKVNVKDSIDAKISGAGSIVYKGNPVERQVSISGAGSVRQMGDGSEEIEVSATVEGSDTTKIKWKGKKLIIVENKDTTAHSNSSKPSKAKKNRIWAGLELGVNGYMNSSGSLHPPASHDFMELNYRKSLVFNFNFLEHSFRLVNNYVMLTTGLGTEFNRYEFDKNYTLIPGSDSLNAFNANVDFSKNSLKTAYLTAPLMLQFNTNKKVKKSFHFAVGVLGGYNFSTHLKQVYENGGEKYKSKVYDGFNVNPFKASATVRIGYGNFNIFANYGLTPLFDKRAAPDLSPFAVGITLVGL